MPLLKKRSFEKVSTALLRDDEEVFYCEITGEVFKDYEEFSERLFLCNSMVWTCSMTGKSNLTYVEALDSEENAKRSLQEFPVELKIPILFIASKTQRTSFGEMADDVFLYTKDRYFIGENLETSFTGNKWKDSHVLQVIAPTETQTQSPPKNGANTEKHFTPASNLYKYEIEHLDAEDEDVSEIMIVDNSQMRRKKTSYSREKCKLFLKQYVQQDDRSVWVIKPSVIESFGINKMKFDQISDGPLPNFETSKRIKLNGDAKMNGKKVRQETLAKYLTKNGVVDAKEKKVANKANLLEAMNKRQEEFKLLKQQKEEERLALRQKKKDDNIKISNCLKEWYKLKEDLQLEDFNKLPVPTPVVSKVPDKYFGDMLMILEFVENFQKILSVKNYFPNGLTLEVMEKVLTEKTVAGPLTDILQMFLVAIFNVQEEESNQYSTQIEKGSSVKEEDMSENLSLHKATNLAILASTWSNTYQGLPLSKLSMFSLTVSEVLRLHLLSSGARINDLGARWRYQERGGYTSEDDPGLYLRLHQPHIIKALSYHSVVQLPIGDKVKILSCLMDQLLTYADVRDIVEDRMEKNRQMKADLKMAQILDKRRETKYMLDRSKLKKESKAEPEALEKELQHLEKLNESDKWDAQKKIVKLMKGAYDKQILLGFDRAFRKYYKLDSVPGFFVNHEEDNFGACYDNIVKQNPELVNASREQTIQHVRKVFEEMNSSDKENEPSKSPPKMNGTHNSLQSDEENCRELLICSADAKTCVIHSTNDSLRVKWSFFHNADDVEALINALNKRGIRESDLQLALIQDKDCLLNIISQTPVTQLNPSVTVEEEEEEQKPQKVAKKNGKEKFDHPNLGFPIDMDPEEVQHNILIENILEMEEKIFSGSLGSLHVENRDHWRDCLSNKNYDELDKTLIRDEDEKPLKIKKEGSRSNTPEVPVKLEINNPSYKDPGRFLGPILEIEPEHSETQENDVLLGQDEKLNNSIKSLAIALAQVARGVDPKFLKRPLGKTDTRKGDKKKDHEVNMLDKWEQSLLASTSFAQIFVHYGTLDYCMMWSRSALLTRCRICRRQRDNENMLLCDNCNMGHHLYCLKPKLKYVPTGDWFCNKCTNEKQKEKLRKAEEPKKKKRRIFREEEEEEEEDNSELEEEEGEEEQIEEDNEENETVKVPLCNLCGSGGELLKCDKCPGRYHIECVEPALKRMPRGAWTCRACKRKEEKVDKGSDSESKGWWQCTGFIYTQRRCAAKARNKIHSFTKSLRRLSESDEEEVVSQRRSHRREDNRQDLPLHNVALQELLADVMKHKDAWPFLRPVQKIEVPDYYDVISKPMDFGTIKYKLNMGEYNEDKLLMQDAVLVFQNCNAYNHMESDVFKCGARLLKHFQKKCKELGLKLPEEMISEDEAEEEQEQPKTKKRRTK